MVSFSCENCNDTVKKPKANQHAQRCKDSLTCIDCSKTFSNGSWQSHNSCISEAEAYQGALYKPTKKELKRKAAEVSAEQTKATKLVVQSPASTVVAPIEDVLATAKKNKSDDNSHKKQKSNNESGQNADLELLKSIIPKDQSMSIHKALKLLRARNKVDKDSEKKLMKGVQLSLSADGAITLT